MEGNEIIINDINIQLENLSKRCEVLESKNNEYENRIKRNEVVNKALNEQLTFLRKEYKEELTLLKKFFISKYNDLLKLTKNKKEEINEIIIMNNEEENYELVNIKKLKEEIEKSINNRLNEFKFSIYQYLGKTPTGENNEKIIKYKGGTLLERFEIQLSNIFFDKNQNIPLVDICELKKLSAALIIKYNNRKSPLETAKEFLEKNLNNNIDEITKMNIDFKRTNVFVEIDDSNYLKKIETNNEQNFIKEFKEKYGILNDDISEKELKKEIEYRKYNEDEIIRVILKKLGYLEKI